MSACRRKLHRFAKATKRVLPRVVSIAITFILSCQMILSNGVTLALAQEAQGSSSGTLQAASAVLAEHEGDGASGSGSLEATQGDGNQGTDPAESGSTTSQDGSAEPSNSTASAAANSSDSSVPSDSADRSDTGQTPETPPSDADDSGDPDSSDAPADKTARTSPRAWDGDTDALSLSSTGFSVDVERTLAQDAATSAQALAGASGASAQAGSGSLNAALGSAAASSAAGAVSGSTAAATGTFSTGAGVADDADASDASTYVLPASVSATLNLAFTFDPTATKDVASGELASAIAGDTITVPLPEGFSAAHEGETFDVYQRETDGAQTTVRIATGTIEGGSVRLTLVAPEDTQTGTTYTVGERNEGDATANLPILRASIDLDVEFDTALAGDEGSQVEWTLQTGADGTRQTATLSIPSRAELAELLGIEPETGENGAAADGDGSGEPADSAANALSADNAVTETTVETKPGTFNTPVEAKIIWCDNNSSARPSTDSLEKGFIPQFSLDGGKTYYDLVDASGALTDEAREMLHMTDGQIGGLPLVSISQTAVGTYTVTSDPLPGQLVTTTKTPVLDGGKPTYDESGEQVFDVETEYQSISWKLKDTNSYPGYQAGENSSWNYQYKMLTGDVTFTVVGKLGNDKLSEVFGDEQRGDFQFGASIDNESQGSITLADLIDNGTLTLTDNGDGTATITGTLPRYNTDGDPIEYWIQFTGAQEGTDYIQRDYDNSASQNHASATDAVYNGGTLTLRHAGTTTFKASKIWLDGGNQAGRPAVTFSLWRYSTNGGSAATASHVQLTRTDGTSTLSELATVTCPAESAGTVDIAGLFSEAYGESFSQLPKYDPDGYAYVYGVREEAVAGYEQVFGTVGDDGSAQDTQPNYYNPAGDATLEYGDGTRPSTDRFVYNGGTISNRLTDTVEVKTTKTWEINAFADYLKEVECTFTLQSRAAGSTDEGAWQDVEGNEDATQVVGNWLAETLTKEVSGTFPKYDSHGNELEYRWVETGVSLGDQDTKFERKENGDASFELTLSTPEGTTETLQFTSTLDAENNQIVNTFANVTHEYVDKYWEQADGSMAQVAPDPDYSDSIAQVQLFQDDKLVGTYEMDGTAEKGATAIDAEGFEGATYQETRSYHLEFKNLPKYSADGSRYTYLVLEVGKDGWVSERTYDADEHLTRIDNYFPEGEGSEIRVTKKWIDGDDAAHRMTAVVELYAKRDMASQAKDPDTGEPLYSYKAGDKVTLSNGSTEIRLTADEKWYTEVDIPISGLTYEDFEVREAYLEDEGGERYPVVTMDEAKEQFPGEEWNSFGWTNPDNRRVATKEHVYEARSSVNEAKQSVEATNRRLGLIDLTATKDWKDGLGADEGGERPAAQIKLSCTEYGDAFSVGDDGTIYVQVSDNRLQVVDSENNPIKGEVKDGAVYVDVDTSKESSSYEFFGLPKYDAQGTVVHYVLEEVWEKDDHGDYRSTKSEGEYTVGTRHFHDHQETVFSNTRYATRDVAFYKEWKDAYVYETLHQRPDIYLTLYQVSEGNEPKAVEGYIHVLWSSLEGEDSADYKQQATISNLPKYDADGKEITYYAVENMPADGKALNYGDVTFSYEHMDASVPESERYIVVDEAAEVSEVDPAVDGSACAIREDGTFVNALTGNMVANGTKLWENIPGNVAQGDLPEVTVYLQQRLAGDEGWKELKVKKDGDAWVPVGDGAVAWTSTLTEVTTNQYSFTMTHYGDNSGGVSAEDAVLLPRYDEQGHLYEYRAREVMWGLLNEPGGFAEGDIINVDLGTDAEGKPVEGLYVIKHGETGSFKLSNSYQSKKGQLTVKKLFSGRDEGDAYPNVTFKVYRYYIDDNGEPSKHEVAAEFTMSGAFFEGTQSSNNGGVIENPSEPGNNGYWHTFTDLDIYAPTGDIWQYYVVEESIDGYSTTVGVGDLEATSGELVEGKSVDGGMRSETLGSEIESALAEDASDDTPDVTFLNEYDEGSTDLLGTKKWDDYQNVFGGRPGELTLTLTRKSATGHGAAETVVLQSDHADEPNYLKWTQEDGTGDWTFEIHNLEKWAPDGAAWNYTVTEEMPDGTTGYYEVKGSSTVNATNPGSGFALENALYGKANVVKVWEDGEDPYGLRPTDVTVQLQAKLTPAQGEQGNTVTWGDAHEVLDAITDGSITEAGFVEDTERVLNDNNGWKASWDKLPVEVRGKDGVLYDVEYRVIETKIGDAEVEVPDDSGSYGNAIYYSYAPSQMTESSSEEVSGAAKGKSWTTTITNTLKSTSVSASKAWEDDDDKWNTRPDANADWEVTFLLQHKVDGGDWEWVVEYGAEPATSGADEQVVKVTLTSDDAKATHTWENLPDTDESGKKYSYRVVEQVPGSYDVTGGTQVVDTDTAHRYYVVGDAGSTQAYTNALRTTELSGTKEWEDYGSGIAPSVKDEGARPTMVLYRSVEGGAAERVKYDGADAPQPEWSEGESGTWVYTYKGLPAADRDDKPYTYWAEEEPGSVDGFYPSYAEVDAAGTTTEQDSKQQGTTITNTATRFTLSKVSDFEGDGELRDIELEVVDQSGITYATWTKDSEGKVSATTWVDGKPAIGDAGGVTSADGAIVGLKAGTYIIIETGEVPEGYVKAANVTITIAKDGSITSTTEGAVTGTVGEENINVEIVDPVLRGHLQLTKYVSSDGSTTAADKHALEGATFSLYREDMDDDGKDELIASGLTTNKDGIVTTVGNDTAIEKWSSKGEQGGTDLTYGGKYLTLADGLPEGTYYFVETATTAGAVMPEGDGARSEKHTIIEVDHYDAAREPVYIEMGNVEFDATVTLKKLDAASGEGIEGATFKLEYKAPGASDYTEFGSNYTTDGDGVLTLSDLDKGDYRLTEVSNEGYDVEEPFTATFTIENADHGKTFDVTSEGGDIDFKVEQGTLADGGIQNARLTGSVAMNKAGGSGGSWTPVNGAVFELQKKSEGDGAWTTVAGGLETGKSYALNVDNTGVEEEGAAETTGQLKVSGLLWGTYRFQETEPADGYLGVDADGEEVTSDEFVIARDSLSASLTGEKTVRNTPTSLEINKRDTGNQALEGAKFTVTPVEGSSFADGSTDAIVLETNGSGLATLSGKLVVGHTYTLYESEAPAAYDPVDGTVTFTVQDDGTLKVEGELPQGYERADVNQDGQADNGFSFMVTDPYIGIEVVKTSAADGSKLEGAKFRLTGFCLDNNTTHEYTTDENGSFTIDALLTAGVEYTLTEVSAPDGYIKMEGSFKFTVDMRGDIVVEGDAPEGFSVAADKVSIAAQNDPTELSITKVSAGGDKLAGAEFMVTPVEGSTFVGGGTGAQTVATDADGVAHMEAVLMVGGTYDITETKAPEGYERVTGTMRVHVADDGSIEVVGSVEDGELAGELAPIGYTKVEDTAFEVQVTNEPVEIAIYKVDAGDSGMRLAGAVFEVEGVFAGEDEPSAREFTTGDDGSVSIDAQLVAGETYTLREKQAPAGYELLTGEVTFAVEEDGTVTVQGEPGAGYSIEQGNVSIVASDQALEASLKKVDEDGEPLAGATFTVAGAFPDGSTEKTFTSDAEGTVFENLALTGSEEGVRYTVTETAAPAGYEVLPAFDLVVYEDGTVELAGDAPQAVRDAFTTADEDGTATCTLADTVIEAKLVKVSTSGGSLAGASFELTGTFADGMLPHVVQVGDDGTVELTGLVAGETYTLRETKAPEGYELIEGEWSFTVGSDGTLSGETTATGGAGYAVEDGGLTVRAVDEPTPTTGGGLPQTGDWSMILAYGAAASGLLFVGGGARHVRRKMEDIGKDDPSGDGEE